VVVHIPLDRLDAAFLAAGSIALGLIRRPLISDQWAAPSVLPKMSVGALACHLGRQPVRAAEILPVATDVLPLDSADAHYDRAAWVTSSSPDDPPNDRSADDAEADLGPGTLNDRTVAALETVRRLLGDGSARNVVLIPWQGWSLARSDFLLTRMLEIVVHCDDLDKRRHPDTGVPGRGLRTSAGLAGTPRRGSARPVRSDQYPDSPRTLQTDLRLLSRKPDRFRTPSRDRQARRAVRADRANMIACRRTP